MRVFLPPPVRGLLSPNGLVAAEIGAVDSILSRGDALVEETWLDGGVAPPSVSKWVSKSVSKWVEPPGSAASALLIAAARPSGIASRGTSTLSSKPLVETREEGGSAYGNDRLERLCVALSIPSPRGRRRHRLRNDPFSDRLGGQRPIGGSRLGRTLLPEAGCHSRQLTVPANWRRRRLGGTTGTASNARCDVAAPNSRFLWGHVQGGRLLEVALLLCLARRSREVSPHRQHRKSSNSATPLTLGDLDRISAASCLN